MENKRGKRGKGSGARKSFKPNPNRFLNSVGHDDRPSGLRSSMPVRPVASKQSPTGAVLNSGIYYEGALIGESTEAHIAPRKSLTEQQYLGLFPTFGEYETLAGKVTDSQGKTVSAGRSRRVWTSDSTLLRRGNPFKGESQYKREGLIREGGNTRRYQEVIEEVPIEDKTQLPSFVIDADEVDWNS